ncbi:hypothetical protein B0H13DRAFT_1852456 [Mycena leptocephala]|nr:hypothetical protein B0H13DRAFT_1852456 [Mycena leptocephala]
MNILTGAWLASRYFPLIYLVAPNIFSVTRARRMARESLFSRDLPSRTEYIQCESRKCELRKCESRKGCELSNLLQEHEYFNGRMARESLFPVIYPVAPNIFSVNRASVNRASVNRARNTKFTAVEGTRNSLLLKEHGNSLPLKQHKITAVERT